MRTKPPSGFVPRTADILPRLGGVRKEFVDLRDRDSIIGKAHGGRGRDVNWEIAAEPRSDPRGGRPETEGKEAPR